MPWPHEPSVIHHEGHDYWRTWFLEECETARIFGVTEKHVRLLTASPDLGGYLVGTEIFLEDAPFYHQATRTYHRVCGPYQVLATDLPPHAIPVHEVDGEVIVYEEPHPERGPWLDRSRVKRRAEGITMTFRQVAREFEYYPYRFRIRRSSKYKTTLVRHKEGCWLCRNVRARRSWR